MDPDPRFRAETRIAHLNAVLQGIRKVNQLITREKDPARLIQKICDLLVEARRFRSVVISRTSGTTGSHAAARPSAAEPRKDRAGAVTMRMLPAAPGSLANSSCLK